MKKFITKNIFFLSLIIIFSCSVYAATNDFTADNNITVSGVTFGTTTADMLIMASSTAESWQYSSGTFSVTNPGSFHVGSADANVKSVKISQGALVLVCKENTIPGISSSTAPTASGTYIIEPSSTTDCTNLCASIPGVATYNSYPTCGAATCSSGYTKTGSGASAGCCASISHATGYNVYPTCGASSCDSGYSLSGSGASAICNFSGGGIISGGGGGGATTDTSNLPTVTRYTYTSPDGTKIDNTTTLVKVKGVVMESKIETKLTPVANPTDTHTIKLDTSLNADIKEVKISLPPNAIKDMIDFYDSGDLKIVIISRKATEEQKTNNARGGMFLIGFDTVSITATINGKNITILDSPIHLSFDINKINYKESLKNFSFNTNNKKWEIVDDGGKLNGGTLEVSLYDLGDFGLLRTMSQTITQKEILNDRALQWQLVLGDAVLNTGSIETLLNNIKEKRNEAGEQNGRKKYTENLTKDLKITNEKISAINNFIVYGTKSTKFLGAGERAGVVSSYKKAFGKLPTTEKEWIDCLAIGNGRWPAEKSAKTENTAKEEFKKIYKRNADMKNPRDNAAVTVIAYGLRPALRNSSSEIAANKIFTHIYKKAPTLASDWDIVRAIAYSGASR